MTPRRSMRDTAHMPHDPAADRPRLNPDGPVPRGYRQFSRSAELAGIDLDAYARALWGWKLHRGAGLDVDASDTPLRVGTTVTVTLKLAGGLVRVPAPCRVTDVWDEDDRKGFAYETLPGHPEDGVESFVLTRPEAGGPIILTIRAVSRPASLAARIGGPLARVLQDRVTEKYLRALDSH